MWMRPAGAPTGTSAGSGRWWRTSLCSTWGAVFRGILCNDRWVNLPFRPHAVMLGYLKRNILGIADYARSPSARQFCRDALAMVARLFRLWYRFRGDLRDRRGNPQPMDRRQLILKSIPLQKKLFALAEAHLDDADREVRNLATALFFNFERLFTFLEEQGVEPTNNVVEQILRTAVQWRKISFGNRSRNGELATARLLMSPRPASANGATYWGTSWKQCAAIAVKLPHHLCSRSSLDHLDCYDEDSLCPANSWTLHSC